jgi:hypothetical protein
MMLGARLGIAVLVDGTPADSLHRFWNSLLGRIARPNNGDRSRSN